MGQEMRIRYIMPYPQITLNIHADESIGTRGLNSGPCLYLHVHPYLVYANSEDSVESAHLRKFASTM